MQVQLYCIFLYTHYVWQDHSKYITTKYCHTSKHHINTMLGPATEHKW